MTHEHDRDLTEGWWEGKPVRFLAGGPTALAPAGLYVAVRAWTAEGRPQLMDGQRPILDAMPGQPGYSALRFVHYYEPGPGTTPDSLRSVADVLDRARRIHTPGQVLHVPVVPVATRTLWPTMPAWHDSSEAAFLDGGLSPLSVNRIYLGIRGIDRKQNRLIYIPGQRWIFEWTPGHPAYGPIARVHYAVLGEGEAPNAVRSVADLLRKSRSLHVTRTFVTAAVLEIDGKPVSPPPARSR
ncbi:MAG: hypothetical protein QJR01_09040 [Kyrpidia sp.]|nr:hypothetical protein [Kyrpidia sp.]